jgi:hypothetical protein
VRSPAAATVRSPAIPDRLRYPHHPENEEHST